jgi:N-acetylmuramoyl-L-alanine amidase
VIKIIIWLISIFGLSLSYGKNVDNYQLKAWRYEVKDNTHGQLIFDLTGSAKYKYFFLKNPDRFVIDFIDTRMGALATASPSIFKQVRTGVPDPHIARVVFELTAPIVVNTQENQQHNQVIFEITHKENNKPVVVAYSPVGLKNINIVVDAGHGGKDPGATGRRGTKEKDVVLGIAKELSRLIEQEPGMHATMTRKGNYYVTLRQRLQRAREDEADVFVAIHADAFKQPRAHGSSVYAVSVKGASSEAAKWLAEKENHSELGGVQLSDTNDVLRSVLIDLSQTETIRSSLQLGRDVLSHLKNVSDLHYSVVEQAPFVVLKSPDIPSILVETGFLSNEAEERRLRDPAYQKLVAGAIMAGLKKYFYRSPPPGTLIAARVEHDRARG